MSDLGNLFNPPYIEDVEGFVTASTITGLVNEIDTTVDLLESAIGNIYGLSSVTDNEEKFTNNIASSLGGMANEYVVPSGVEFADYSQSFTLNDNKTFVLDLIPSSSVLIDDGIHPTSFWTEQLSTKDLAVSTDYCIIGTLITFYAPASNFTITYTGTYPQFGEDGYLPNIIPNRRLRNIYAIAQPTVTNVSGIRYNIIIDTSDGNGYIGLADTIDYELAPHLAMYVDPLGVTECPSQYISVWSKSGTKFNKIDTTAIFIKSETEYEFITNETVSLLDEHAIILSNRGIADDLYATINLLLNHSHNSEDGTNTIAHASLNDLIPVSDNADIKYAGSVLSQNHHPQYLHREGYQNDPGTYNNAMLGDLLLSSINPSSLFNNILSDSNKIFFGSTSTGHSIGRRTSSDDLHVASSANGLSISYNNTDINNYGLAIVGHKFIDFNSDLIINSTSGLTIFENELEELQNIAVDEVLSNTINAAQEVIIATDGQLSIGNITIEHNTNDIIVSGTNNATDKMIIDIVCDIENANIVNLNIDTINLEGADKIKFLPNVGADETYFAPLAAGGAKFSSAKPLALTGVGKNTGLSLSNAIADEVYGNIYVSSENGLIPTGSDHNTFIETGTQSAYFLQDTTEDKTIDGILYSWDNSGTTGVNVTNLKNWPKSDVYANTFNGSKFKLDQYNAISATGSLQGINSNKTIIHADNGVLFTRDQSGIYLDAVGNKSSIEAESILLNSAEIVSIETESLSAKDITVPLDGTMSVAGATTFNGTVAFNNDIEFNDDVTISANLKVLNTITGADVNGNLTIAAGGILTVIKESQFFGNTTFASQSTFNSPIFSNSLITANAGISANNIDVTNTLAAATANIGDLNIVAVSTQSIICQNIDALSATTPSTFKSIDINTDLSVGRDVSISGNITLASGKQINASGASITGLVMPLISSPTDATTKQYVDDALANIGTANLLKIMYPITSIYISSHNPNSPGAIDGTGPFGMLSFGTWEAYGEGRVMIGSGISSSDDNAISRTFIAPATGGAYGHSLTEPELAPHTHQYTFSNDRNDDGDNNSRNCIGSVILTNGFTTTSAGNGDLHNNVQPYVTVYIWRRVA